MQRRLCGGSGDGVDVVVASNNLAALLRSVNRIADAEALLVDAHAMVQRLWRKQDSSAGVRQLLNLASLYVARRRLQEAETHIVDAVGMARRLWGDQPHTDVVKCVTAMGVLRKSQLRFDDAETQLQAALSLTRLRWKDRDHVDCMRQMAVLAALYRDMRRCVVSSVCVCALALRVCAPRQHMCALRAVCTASVCRCRVSLRLNAMLCTHSACCSGVQVRRRGDAARRLHRHVRAAVGQRRGSR
jgi:hypothetical protein